MSIKPKSKAPKSAIGALRGGTGKGKLSVGEEGGEGLRALDAALITANP
jgi:hypothetical protein